MVHRHRIRRRQLRLTQPGDSRPVRIALRSGPLRIAASVPSRTPPNTLVLPDPQSPQFPFEDDGWDWQPQVDPDPDPSFLPSGRAQLRRASKKRDFHHILDKYQGLFFQALRLDADIAPPCDCPAAAPITIKVITIDSAYTLSILTCHSHFVPMLFSQRLFPSTPLRPRIAFTMHLLSVVHSLVSTSGISMGEVAKAVGLVHADAGETSLHHHGPFDPTSLQEAYHWYHTARRGMQRLLRQPALCQVAPSQSEWELTIDDLSERCPRCFGGMKTAPIPSSPLRHDAYISIDGNFQHKRHHRADIPSGATLPLAIMLPTSQVDSMGAVLDQLPRSRTTQCAARFKAADPTQAKASLAQFDVTGLMLLSCRHDVPLIACDIDTPGEQQKYPLALLDALMAVIDPYVESVGVLYDIACQFSGSLVKYDLLPKYRRKLHFATALFHSYAHDYACQTQFSPRKVPRFGLTDGEGNERVWSLLRNLVVKTRSMSKQRRRELLDWRMQRIAAEKSEGTMRHLSTALISLHSRARRLRASAMNDDWAANLRPHLSLRTDEPNPHLGVDPGPWRGALEAAPPDAIGSLLQHIWSPFVPSEVVPLLLWRLNADARLGSRATGSGVPLAWSGLERLLQTRNRFEHALTATRPGSLSHTEASERLASHDAYIDEHLRKHRITHLCDPHREWMRLAITCHARLTAIHSEAVAAMMQAEKVARRVHVRGTRAAEWRNRQASERSGRLSKLVQQYNTLCDEIHAVKPQDRRNPAHITTSAGKIPSPSVILAQMANAGGCHAMESSLSELMPWRGNVLVRESLDGYETCVRVREEYEILWAEYRRTTLYLLQESQRLRTALAAPPSALTWHVRRRYRRVHALQRRWFRDLQVRKGALGGGQILADRQAASAVLRSWHGQTAWPRWQTSVRSPDGACPDHSGSEESELSSSDAESVASTLESESDGDVEEEDT